MKTKLRKLLADARYRNRIIHDYEMRKGKVRFFSKPLRLQIEPTNRCNLSCAMCARPYYDAEKNIQGDMAIETFEKLAPFVRVAERVDLIGYGEPLIAKNFWYFLEKCNEAKVFTSIYTNGVALNVEASERLVKGGLGSLTVSLDAARENTFRAIRKCSLQKIKDNLAALRNTKEKLGKSTPAVNINFVLMKDNLEELPEMVGMAKELGAIHLDVSHLMMYSRSLEYQSAFHHLPKAREVFEETSRRAKEEGIWVVLPSLGRERYDCMQPFEMLFINWNGKVRPCCSAAFVSEKLNMVVGDINNESLSDIWNNDLMIKIREGLLGKGELMPQCVNCGFRIKDVESHRRYLD